jgi:G3E family GTPase
MAEPLPEGERRRRAAPIGVDEARRPIVAHVIAGPLGVGKTTVLARLLAAKPPAENWVALLNEFTDAGIDALTVAAAARGAYDVRLVEGGCLCCAGELEFRRTLAELVAHVQPHRILVEPSGLGHPAGVVEELLGYESRDQIELRSVVTLVDVARLDEAVEGRSGLLADQVGIADVLVLNKGDLADPAARTRFAAWAAGLYPRKRWHGVAQWGELPEAALAPRELPAPQVEPDRAHAHAVDAIATSWRFGREREFAEDRLRELVAAGAAGLPDGMRVRRLKGIFRVGEDRWLLVQIGPAGAGSVEEASWRRDSRVELLLEGRTAADAPSWAALWAACRGAGPA